MKKASLALFLKEQLAYHERHVLEEVEKNAVLRDHLGKANEASQKLLALNEEIEMSPNVTQLREIIAAAERKPLTAEDLLRELPFPFDTFSKVGLLFSRSLSNVLQTLK
ncbi:hypothetical protein D3C71_1511130 [compost metagenome]